MRCCRLHFVRGVKDEKRGRFVKYTPTPLSIGTAILAVALFQPMISVCRWLGIL